MSTVMFLDISARPGAPDAVKTAEDILAENNRLRDLVKRMASAMEFAAHDNVTTLPGSYFRLLAQAHACVGNDPGVEAPAMEGGAE